MDKLVKSQKKMIANHIAQMDASSSQSMVPAADEKKEYYMIKFSFISSFKAFNLWNK